MIPFGINEHFHQLEKTSGGNNLIISKVQWKKYIRNTSNIKQHIKMSNILKITNVNDIKFII